MKEASGKKFRIKQVLQAMQPEEDELAVKGGDIAKEVEEEDPDAVLASGGLAQRPIPPMEPIQKPLPAASRKLRITRSMQA